MECTKVFVGRLPPGTKPKELRHLFQNYGIVVECDVLNRCGFVHMETTQMAQNAIISLNASEFKGQNIVVEPGRPKERKPGVQGAAPAIKSGNMAMPAGPSPVDLEKTSRNFNVRGRGGNMQGNRGGSGSRGSRGGQHGQMVLRGANFNAPNSAATSNSPGGPMRNLGNFKTNRSAPYPQRGGSSPHMRGKANFKPRGAGAWNSYYNGFNGQNFDNNRDMLQSTNFPHFNKSNERDFSNGFAPLSNNPRQSNNNAFKANLGFNNSRGQDRRGFTLSAEQYTPGRPSSAASYHQQQTQSPQFLTPPNHRGSGFQQSRTENRGGHSIQSIGRPGQIGMAMGGRQPFNNQQTRGRNFSSNSSNFNTEFPALNGSVRSDGPSNRGRGGNRPSFRGITRGGGGQRRFN